MARRNNETISNSIAEFAFLLLMITILGTTFLDHIYKKNKTLLESTRLELDQTKGQLILVSDSLRIAQKLLEEKSLIKKQCYEIKALNLHKYLSNISVLGKDQFLIGSHLLNLKELKDKFRQDLGMAKSNDCLLLIKIIPGTDLVEDYQAGKKQLRSLFIIHEQYLK